MWIGGLLSLALGAISLQGQIEMDEPATASLVQRQHNEPGEA